MTELTRREFVLICTAAGLVPVVAATARDAALTMKEKVALLALAHTLFAHERVDDAAYAAAVAAVDARCSGDPTLLEIVAAGIMALDSACSGSFANAPAARRIAALKEMERTPFFEIIYAHIADGLYGRADAWSMFVPLPATRTNHR